MTAKTRLVDTGRCVVKRIVTSSQRAPAGVGKRTDGTVGPSSPNTLVRNSRSNSADERCPTHRPSASIAIRSSSALSRDLVRVSSSDVA
jgi:hypothetical protein